MLLAQRFFFDLTDGRDAIRDEEGVLAANFDEAIRQAKEVLEELRRNRELSGRDEEWTLIIRNAAGETQATLPVVPRDPKTALAS